MSSSPTSLSSSEARAPEPSPLSGLFDVVCPVELVLGQAALTVRDCLNLEPGRVVRLNAGVGEDLHLAVGGVGLMRGEVVFVDDRAAVRITEIVPAPGAEA